jgi:hypothetical protein
MSHKKYSTPLILFGYAYAAIAAISITVSIPHTIPYTERANALLQAIVAFANVSSVPAMQAEPWNVTYNDGWSQPVMIEMRADPSCMVSCGTDTWKMGAFPNDAKWTNPSPTTGGSGGSSSGSGTAGTAGYSVTINGHWRTPVIVMDGISSPGNPIWVLDSVTVNTTYDPGSTTGTNKKVKA